EVRVDAKGYPEFKPKKLKEWLTQVTTALTGLHGQPLPVPSVNGQTSINPDDWSRIAPYDTLLEAWFNLMSACGVRAAVAAQQEVVHPRYEVLPRLRTRGPDVEAMRRLGLPLAFVPVAGQFLVVTFQDLE